MSLWSLTKPPTFHSDAIATKEGWVNPKTGEILVAIGNLGVREGTSVLESCTITNPAKTLYKLGDLLELHLQYTKNVVVTGTPRVTFSVGGTNTSANYTSGSGTNVLKFQYTVLNSHSGAVTIVSPAQLNSGTIKDADNASHNSPLAFAVPNTSAMVIDGVAPTISGATINGPTFVTGNKINLTLTTSENVTVTGVPSIAVSINGVAHQATYFSGTGSTSLVFSYTVASGDHATAGQFTVSSPVVLNGGSVLDRVGNAATLTFTAPTTTSVTVN